MIYHGIDMIEVARITHAIERYGERFLKRVFTNAEIVRYGDRPSSLAARWAAKEATAKLLGVGLRGLGAGTQFAGVAWTDIEVIGDELGQPTITLSGAAEQRACTLGIATLALSLTHTRDLAIASVVGLGSNTDTH
ncbi:MAG: holo-ACP synthase [Roseiflexaceae bacterium]|nr:holo-ACP synthase [Roseiflexaceae bacterium]